jgi:hypothetical protein
MKALKHKSLTHLEREASPLFVLVTSVLLLHNGTIHGLAHTNLRGTSIRIAFLFIHLAFVLIIDFILLAAFFMVVVVTLAAPFDHRFGLGGAASDDPNDEETGKGSDGKDGTIGDGTRISTASRIGEFAEREKQKDLAKGKKD